MRYSVRVAYAIAGLCAALVCSAVTIAGEMIAFLPRMVDYDVRAMRWQKPRTEHATHAVLKDPPTLNLDLRLASILSHIIWQRQMYRVREMA